MATSDPCIRETHSARITRLEGDLIAWAEALGINPAELVSIMGLLSCRILAALEREGRTELLTEYLATFKTGVEICRKGLKK
jgi:hypothetical protein